MASGRDGLTHHGGQLRNDFDSVKIAFEQLYERRLLFKIDLDKAIELRCQMAHGRRLAHLSRSS